MANQILNLNQISSEDKKNLEKRIAQSTVLDSKKYFKYKIKKGDSLEKIAKNFGLKIDDLKKINNFKSDKIITGNFILIPQNIKITSKITKPSNYRLSFKPAYVSALTNIGGLLVPTDGLNQKRIHGNNGVDISSPCGTPVYSAEDGIVIEAKNGYNGGYGNYILIQHKYFETLYGHLSNIYVTEGNYIIKGELIGTVGNTGYTVGETGCHLHFEVRGSKNPLSQ